LMATVLVGDHTTGDRVVRLRERAQIELPPGVQLEGFKPAIVSVRLEPRVERQVNVDLKFEGKVPEGYEVYGASANPAKVRVRGPASIVNAIQKAPTESISLDGRTDSFDLTQVAVDISDQKVDGIDGIVQVHVEVGERAVEKTFSNVPVRSANGANLKPQVATLTLSAPVSVLAQLRPEHIQLVVDTSATMEVGRNNGFRLELPATVQSRVKLVSVKPARFLTGGR